jgi:hypothetical protein
MMIDLARCGEAPVPIRGDRVYPRVMPQNSLPIKTLKASER